VGRGGTSLIRCAASEPRFNARGPHEAWSDERVLAELRRVCAGRETFPTMQELHDGGHSKLAGAIRRRGGIQAWARRFGLPMRLAQARTPLTLDEAISEARDVIRTQGYLPGPPALRRLGRFRLANFVSGAGGSRRFRAENAAALDA
jgi:hypothetical protein